MKFRTLLFSSILLISIFSITGCTKDDSIDATTEEYYAKNNITNESTESVTNTENSTISQDELTETTEEKIESLQYQYNVDIDANANENLSEDIISIDGKLVSFPCDYTYLKSIFTELYVETYNDLTGELVLKELDESNYNSINILELIYKPTTGYGSVKFIIRSRSDESTDIKNCVCNEVILSGNTVSNEKLMTIALIDNIHFGSTIEDIKASFGNVPSLYNAYSDDSFIIEYIGDETGNEYYFSGKSGGLSNINLKYNIDNNLETSENDIDDE